MDSFLMMHDAHYCMQIPPSGDKHPTWMVCPSLNAKHVLDCLFHPFNLRIKLWMV